MGSGNWFKNIIGLKKVKGNRLKQLKGSSTPEKSDDLKLKDHSQKESTISTNGVSAGNPTVLHMPAADVAATRIQAAFRAYMARKDFHCLKGAIKLQILTQHYSVAKQASTTLSYLHSWSRIQAQIRARRLSMVTEGRIRRKKLENQLKLEAKLHDLEVEWCGGSETMEEILARTHQREEAAVKRERAMAYAFSHQWRANSNPNLGAGSSELGNTKWVWSWMERWIAARPWESRAPIKSSAKTAQSQLGTKAGKNLNSPITKLPVSAKSISPHGKGTMKAQKLSVAADKPAPQEGSMKSEEENTKKEELVS